MDLDDPIAVALLAAEALESQGIPHALYGGLLLAAYGDARETRDADLAVLEPDVTALERALRAKGIDTARAFERVVFGGLVLSRLTVLGATGDSGLNTIDLVAPRSASFARAVLGRVLRAPLRDRTVCVVTPEDFVLLKLLSTRDKDLDDAASVMARSGDVIDRDELEREVATLDSALPEAGVARRWTALLTRGGT
ncbi:MAG: hypothetical protein HY909_09860 [Deltaproteobacteria bacterium]|nr:hypothetical protein [Deltaproteobacteria bacterium]